MDIVRVISEWDLGIPELYQHKSLAEIYVRGAISYMEEDLDMTYEECISEGCISYECVEVVMEPE